MRSRRLLAEMGLITLQCPSEIEPARAARRSGPLLWKTKFVSWGNARATTWLGPRWCRRSLPSTPASAPITMLHQILGRPRWSCGKDQTECPFGVLCQNDRGFSRFHHGVKPRTTVTKPKYRTGEIARGLCESALPTMVVCFTLPAREAGCAKPGGARLSDGRGLPRLRWPVPTRSPLLA
jgi:hypothetical protein